MRTKLFLISLLIINSCTDKKPSSKFQAVRTQYCYLYNIKKIDSIYFLNVDFIKVLTSDSAIIVAKKHGQAEYEISESGDTTWFVANDYFILNEKTDSVKIPIDENCKIVIYISDETTNFQPKEKSINVEELKNYLSGDRIFEIKIANEKVKAIKEFWVP